MANAFAPEAACCPVCRGALHAPAPDALSCTACDRRYLFRGAVPVLIDPEHQATYLDHYRIDAEEFDYFEEPGAATAHEERRLHESIAASIPRDAGTILDVGCGRAWVAARFCPEGRAVWSLDASEHNPQRALERYPLPTHAAVAADALQLPFRDGTFDAVVAAEIIEHVHDPRAFVRELFRVVKPGGKLVVTTPYRERLRYVLCVHCNQKTPVYAHLHSFDEKVLLDLYQGPNLQEAHWKTFSNKALTFLRFHPVLSPLPYGMWKLVDRAANRVVNKPLRIQVEYVKRPIT